MLSGSFSGVMMPSWLDAEQNPQDDKTKRPPDRQEHTKTNSSLAPLTVDEALSALLRRPPPKDEPKQPGKKSARKKGR
jgi:hypothetical protein